MADEQKDKAVCGRGIAEAMESLTVWMPASSVRKLNRMARALSTEKELLTKQDVVRILVRRAKE